MKILMLWPNIKEDIPNILATHYSDVVEVRNLYKKVNPIQRATRKYISDFGLSTYVFLDDWKREIEKYDMIIIHANRINRTVPVCLRNKGYKGRIIYWFWNPVSNCINPQKVDRRSCELWSFDKNDCHKYDLKYNSTYYFSRIASSDSCATNTVFFVGRDKNRYSYIKKLEERIQSVGFNTDFYIIKDETSKSDRKYSEMLSYTDVVKKTKNCSCILDVVQKGQVGLSLRPMEAIFFGKKHLTTNYEIKQEPFFNEKDFYVLGDTDDNDERLKEFLFGSYIEQPKELLAYYDFENWINRFI